jgi:dolichyl-phosphate beta-glucosyltransferase
MTLTQLVLGFKVKDTQCGFKMFTREASKLLYPTQHLERWAFDIELLYLCGKKNIVVKESPVKWHDVDGSHLNIFDATV